MSSVELLAVPVASNKVTFDYLHLGRSNQEVVCRILRFWDARNVRREGEFMGIVVLLLDDKNNLIHTFIPASMAVHHRRDLKDNAVVKIDRFEVSRCTKMYKITDHAFVIRFLSHTTLTHLDNYSPKIELEKFMVRMLDHLQALANTNQEFPDVVGQIRFVQGSNLEDATSTQRIVVRLLIEPSVTVCVSLWDDAAATFIAHLGSEAAVFSTMLMTNVNSKLFGVKSKYSVGTKYNRQQPQLIKLLHVVFSLTPLMRHDSTSTQTFTP